MFYLSCDSKGKPLVDDRGQVLLWTSLEDSLYGSQPTEKNNFPAQQKHIPVILIEAKDKF